MQVKETTNKSRTFDLSVSESELLIITALIGASSYVSFKEALGPLKLRFSKQLVDEALEYYDRRSSGMYTSLSEILEIE